MTWEQAMQHARRRSIETGRRWYVRGYRRTISHVGGWRYGAYAEPWPLLVGRFSRPSHWGDPMPVGLP